MIASFDLLEGSFEKAGSDAPSSDAPGGQASSDSADSAFIDRRKVPSSLSTREDDSKDQEE